MSIDIDIWIWRLEGDAATTATRAAWLSPDEAERADRFVQEKHRLAHIHARGRLRELLSRYTGTAPDQIAFAYGPHGKPFVHGGPMFNLSHAGGVALLAVHPELPLGADMEAIRDIEDGVARRFFSQAEYRALSTLSPGDWTPAFFRCWTRKEAIVKALGAGLTLPLDSFDVTLRPQEPARLLRLDGQSSQAGDWAMAHLSLKPDLVGAVAMKTGGTPLRLHIKDAPPGLVPLP